MMVVSGIPSARKKLDRAKFHLDELDRAVHAFREDSPYKFDMGSAGNEPYKPDFWIDVTVSEAPPVPNEWALITGDILTNLRGSLDHAVFPHIHRMKPDLDRKHIKYPIHDRKEQWEPKKPWFERAVRDVIGDSQPYRAADHGRHPLRVLRELVNMDKHRDLVIANYAVDDFQVAPQDFFRVVWRTVFLEEMVTGTRVARAHLQLVEAIEGHQWKEFHCWVDYGETIKVPDVNERFSLLGKMKTLVQFVGQLLNDLEQAGC